MNQFIKNNWLKLIISLAIILACVAIIYYFIIYLPEENSKKEYLSNQIKCQQEGMKLYENDKKDETPPFIILEPEFKFNMKINACLYKGGQLTIKDGHINYSKKFIKDVYTNKYILEWDQCWDSNIKELKDCWSNESVWIKNYNELFGN